jgi:regulator of sirC expression with transglutaminase-like and TPR domain/S1-C subfamily serine protease
VTELATRVRPSLAVITVRGRDGKSGGLGTGFVISADGLIATNRHVIGEGRSITVEMADGKRYVATAVHASDRALDLAVVRIAARDLQPLALGDSGKLPDGLPVVAMGNPHGLKHSVVAGVVSGRRDIDGRPMIQVAIPIEPGNSGGPLLDMQGRVLGIMTIKSLVTPNLGFAVGVNSLRPLLARPNPVLMSAWLTIGALDSDEWMVRGGGHWRQRAGRIIGDGVGSGFGGRALCLSRRPVPAAPFEVAVLVKMDDESGAAGLVFQSDGLDRHYGFYPSNGQMRLTRFDGPDVFSWKVLRQESSTHYRPGEWNALKVRVEKGRMRCFVNDQLVFEQDDDALTEGKVGLARFRNTVAEFKQFQVARELPAASAPVGLLSRVGKVLESLPPGENVRPEMIGKTPGTPATLAALRERARQLDAQAAQLRRLAGLVHQETVLSELARTLKGKEENIDLLRAALLIARLDNDEVDVEHYRAEVEQMARKVALGLPKGADEKARLAALNRYLFTEKGFHGSRGDYYHRSNSYLPEVIDDREGLPITLAVLYLEMGRRLGLKMEGVGLPGHFVVRHRPAEGPAQLIDVYEGGAVMTREEASRKVRDTTGGDLEEEHLAAVPKQAIIVRMLRNLLRVAQGERDAAGALRYVEAILTLTPDSAPDRGMRAGLRYQAGDRKGSLEDIDWLLENRPEGVDLERVRQMKRFLMREER